MTTLEQPALARERATPADCEIGDWVASSRVEDWNKKIPVQEFRSPDDPGVRVFVRSHGRASGMVQTLWKRVE